MTSLLVADAQAMEEAGRLLSRSLRAGDVVVLNGPLGAGKTTFSRGVGEGLGVETAVQSPTFIVAREHPRVEPGLPPLLHVDAYRLDGAAELVDLDLDIAHSITLMEWGRDLVAAVTTHWLDVDIAFGDSSYSDPSDVGDAPRRVTFTAHATSPEDLERWTTIVKELHDSLD